MTTGFTGGDAATGPTAGYDPVMKFRGKLKKKDAKKLVAPGNKIGEEKDHEVSMAQAQLKKAEKNIKTLKKKLGNKEKNIPAWVQAKITDTEHNTDAAAGYTTESRENPTMPSRLFQYKVTMPEIGETILYANSPTELAQKMRILVNPRYRGDIKIERIMPGEAGKFFMDKRMKHMRNVQEQADKQMQMQMTQQQIGLEQKKANSKIAQIKKELQKKTAALKQKARVGGAQSTVDK